MLHSFRGYKSLGCLVRKSFFVVAGALSTFRLLAEQLSDQLFFYVCFCSYPTSLNIIYLFSISFLICFYSSPWDTCLCSQRLHLLPWILRKQMQLCGQQLKLGHQIIGRSSVERNLLNTSALVDLSLGCKSKVKPNIADTEYK